MPLWESDGKLPVAFSQQWWPRSARPCSSAVQPMWLCLPTGPGWRFFCHPDGSSYLWWAWKAISVTLWQSFCPSVLVRELNRSILWMYEVVSIYLCYCKTQCSNAWSWLCTGRPQLGDAYDDPQDDDDVFDEADVPKNMQCDIDGIANPDNVAVVDAHDGLIIGEDTQLHQVRIFCHHWLHLWVRYGIVQHLRRSTFCHRVSSCSLFYCFYLRQCYHFAFVLHKKKHNCSVRMCLERRDLVPGPPDQGAAEGSVDSLWLRGHQSVLLSQHQSLGIHYGCCATPIWWQW